MDRRERNDLDRHITGNYGEDSVTHEPKERQQFTIEKGVPVTGSIGRYTTYPFRKMDVGDSFFVGADKVKAARAAAHMAGRRGDFRFVTRQEKDGIRIWRVA